MKRCPRCKEEKPLDQFNVAKRNKDGRQCYCRPCARELVRKSEARRKAGLIVKREVPDGHKFCPRCETVKPFDEFHRISARKPLT